MATYKLAKVPANGDKIAFENGSLKVPDNPIVPFVEGDGTGADIWRASIRVFDAAVERAYDGERRLAWGAVFAGEKSFSRVKDWVPRASVEALQELGVSVIGRLITPVGRGPDAL